MMFLLCKSAAKGLNLYSFQKISFQGPFVKISRCCEVILRQTLPYQAQIDGEQ